MERELQFMQEAIRLGIEGMRNNEGGPFGCVIVKDNIIVGRGWNKVVATTDPTAHAEVVAIRDACKNLHSFQLEDCEVYTSCEPCPMCLGAIYWARPKSVYYANTREDAATIGFDDNMIYEELEKKLEERKLVMQCLGREHAIKMFEEWSVKADKNCY
jgi:guanine deaminase